MKTNLKSVIMVLLAGCLWGCMGLLVRPLNACGLVSMDIVAIRSWVTFLTVLISFPVLCKLINRQSDKTIRELAAIRLRDIWVFIGTGIVSVVFFNFCYFSTIVLTDLSVAAIMLYTAPIFVMIFSAVIFKERITRIKIIALVMAFAGCVVVTGVVSGSMLVDITGILFGLGSGIGYALYSIFGKLATDKGYSSVTVTLYTFLFASVGVIPFCDVENIISGLEGRTGLIIYSVVMILLVTYFPYVLYTSGLADIEPGKAAVIATIEPVAATVVGLAVFGEVPKLITIVGVVMVLAAILLINTKD